MRVLIWSQYFWPENFKINQLAKELCEQGEEVCVLTGKPNYPSGKIFPGYKMAGIKEEVYEGIEVARIPIIPRGKNNYFQLLFNYISFIFSGLCIAPYALRNKEFDTIFVYAPSPIFQAIPAIALGRRRRVPMITWVQDLWPDTLENTKLRYIPFLIWLVKQITRFIYKHSDLILIQSEGFRPSVEKLVKNKEKIYFFPNPGEKTLDCFPHKKTKQIVAVENSFSVVFAGNLGAYQSCDTILKAAQILKGYPEIKLFLIGEGRESASLSEVIKTKAIKNAHILGALPVEKMPEIYAASSVLLVSLKKDRALSATIPSKLQSYFAAGKPILASLGGEAARLVVEAKAGLTCPPEDPQALASAILALYRMTPKERATFGENGRKYFEANFVLENLVSELREHLEATAF